MSTHRPSVPYVQPWYGHSSRTPPTTVPSDSRVPRCTHRSRHAKKSSPERHTTMSSPSTRAAIGPPSASSATSATGCQSSMRTGSSIIAIPRASDHVAMMLGRSWSLPAPPEHTQGPKGVPPARSALALVHREVHLAGMGIFERPATLHVALGLDQLDRLRHPLVGS